MLIPTDLLAAWPTDEATALAEQSRLRPLVRTETQTKTIASADVRLIAGVDVSYAKDESIVVGAAVVLEMPTLRVVETATAARPVEFPYIPGLLAFREIPALLDALATLTADPDAIVCDGYGIAHPRRFGLACHLGVLTDHPTFGVAKTAFVGKYVEPGPNRGDTSPLVDASTADEVTTETIGRVLRTQRGVKPVFVSTGHRIDLDTATELTLALTPVYRLPETTRQADHLSRQILATQPPKAS